MCLFASDDCIMLLRLNIVPDEILRRRNPHGTGPKNCRSSRYRTRISRPAPAVCRVVLNAGVIFTGRQVRPGGLQRGQRVFRCSGQRLWQPTHHRHCYCRAPPPLAHLTYALPLNAPRSTLLIICWCRGVTKTSPTCPLPLAWMPPEKSSKLVARCAVSSPATRWFPAVL